MKLKILEGVIIIPVLVSFAIGCKKEHLNVGSTNASIENARSGNQCRLLGSVNNFGYTNFLYNTNGLCSEMQIAGFTYNLEYDRTGKLSIARTYFEGEVWTTTHFFYNTQGRISKEIWYAGNNQLLIDEVFYTLNSQGLITRMESFINSFYVSILYSTAGNATEWHYVANGMPVASGYHTYQANVRNPFLAVPGVEHLFNSAQPYMFSNRWAPKSDSIFVYDVSGAHLVYDEEESLTTFVIGGQNYPVQSNYYDNISATWINGLQFYENCGGRPTGQTSKNIGKELSSFNLLSTLHLPPALKAKQTELLQKLIRDSKKK